MGKKNINNKGVRAMIKLTLFMIYICVLCYVLFFAENMGRKTGERLYSYNLVPFNEIKRYLYNVETIGLNMVLINLLGNILLFLPFGFLLPSFWPEDEKKHPIAMFIIAMLFSAVVECLQFMTGVGSADVDDIILNTAGAMLGYFIYRLRCIIRKGR